MRLTKTSQRVLECAYDVWAESPDRWLTISHRMGSAPYVLEQQGLLIKQDRGFCRPLYKITQAGCAAWELINPASATESREYWAKRKAARPAPADYLEASRTLGRNALVEMDAPEVVATARAVCDAYTGITRSAMGEKCESCGHAAADHERGYACAGTINIAMNVVEWCQCTAFAKEITSTDGPPMSITIPATDGPVNTSSVWNAKEDAR